MAYNEAHGIVPKTIVKAIDNSLGTLKGTQPVPYSQSDLPTSMAAESQAVYLSKEQIQKAIALSKKNMEKAVKEMDFLAAAKYRDEMVALQEQLRN